MHILPDNYRSWTAVARAKLKVPKHRKFSTSVKMAVRPSETEVEAKLVRLQVPEHASIWFPRFVRLLSDTNGFGVSLQNWRRTTDVIYALVSGKGIKNKHHPNVFLEGFQLDIHKHNVEKVKQIANDWLPSRRPKKSEKLLNVVYDAQKGWSVDHPMGYLLKFMKHEGIEISNFEPIPPAPQIDASYFCTEAAKKRPFSAGGTRAETVSPFFDHDAVDIKEEDNTQAPSTEASQPSATFIQSSLSKAALKCAASASDKHLKHAFIDFSKFVSSKRGAEVCSTPLRASKLPRPVDTNDFPTKPAVGEAVGVLTGRAKKWSPKMVDSDIQDARMIINNRTLMEYLKNHPEGNFVKNPYRKLAGRETLTSTKENAKDYIKKVITQWALNTEAGKRWLRACELTDGEFTIDRVRSRKGDSRGTNCVYNLYAMPNRANSWFGNSDDASKAAFVGRYAWEVATIADDAFHNIAEETFEFDTACEQRVARFREQMLNS